MCKRLDQFNTFLATHPNSIHELHVATPSDFETHPARCSILQACNTTSFPMYWYGPRLSVMLELPHVMHFGDVASTNAPIRAGSWAVCAP